jgi:hypothetical protein
MMENLRQLQSDYEAQGLQEEEEDEPIDWDDVREELENAANHTHRPDSYDTDYCAHCGAKIA